MEAEDSNFGENRYVFELELRGNIDTLILNLMRAGRNPAVRGLVVVTEPGQIKQVTEEIEGLPDDFKCRLSFLTIDDLNKVYENLITLSAFRSKLGLQIYCHGHIPLVLPLEPLSISTHTFGP